MEELTACPASGAVEGREGKEADKPPGSLCAPSTMQRVLLFKLHSNAAK